MASYKNYTQSKATVAKNTMPSISKFEPACISPTRQEVISPTSYQSLDSKGTMSKIFILSQYAKQNNLLLFTKDIVLKLRDANFLQNLFFENFILLNFQEKKDILQKS